MLDSSKDIEPKEDYSKWSSDDFIGKSIKMAFPCDGGRKEYMWVKVEKCLCEDDEGFILKGILCNDPIYFRKLKCGGIVEFCSSDVVDVMAWE